MLFYSDVRGSGNHYVSKLVLPIDPPTFPTDANPGGTGGPTIWNFQLHPAFWYGMALCDSESFPIFTRRCEPDSDENIFDSGDHIRRGTSDATREPRSWSCSSTLQVG